ncbi:unnamed protein product, partial [Closterium sp. Naga37s-1]
ETQGTENLPLDRGMFFMACNHSSHLDCGATFVGAWTGGAKRVYALGARDYFFSNPLLAWFVTTCMHVITINRRKFSQQELDTLLQLKATSGPQRPTAVLIFPEGTRSLTGSLQPFKSGVGLLAEQLDVPVVPVCVQGTFEALPKGRTIPLRRRVTVEFGRPLDVQEYLQVAQVAPPNAAVVSSPASTQGDAVQSTSATEDPQQAFEAFQNGLYASYAAAASLLACVPVQAGETAGFAAALALCFALLIAGFRPLASWAGPYLFFPSDDQEEMP